MYEYATNRTLDAFNNFNSNISDIHQHDAINLTQKQIYRTFQDHEKDKKSSAIVVLIFGISLSEN